MVDTMCLACRNKRFRWGWWKHGGRIGGGSGAIPAIPLGSGACGSGGLCYAIAEFWSVAAGFLRPMRAVF